MNVNNIRFFIDDMHDKDRLCRAFRGVDIVIHSAALKHVTVTEYNPIAAIKTKMQEATNIIDASIACGVAQFAVFSTDKAANPIYF